MLLEGESRFVSDERCGGGRVNRADRSKDLVLKILRNLDPLRQGTEGTDGLFIAFGDLSALVDGLFLAFLASASAFLQVASGVSTGRLISVET